MQRDSAMLATRSQPHHPHRSPNTSLLIERLAAESAAPAHAAWIRARLKHEQRKPALHLRPCLLATPFEDGPPRYPAPRLAPLRNDTIGVVLFDDRPHPHTAAMLALFDALRRLGDGEDQLSFHAVLGTPVPMAGVTVTSLESASAHVRCVQRGLARFVSTKSKLAGVLYKPLLHWLLPPGLARAIVLDTDLVPVRPLSALRADFDAMRSKRALFGAVAEQSTFYGSGRNMPKGVPGYNTGVWLLDLEAMRASARYTWYLDAYQSGVLFKQLGLVPEQNMANGIAGLEPALFHTVGCEWNRQLGSWRLSAHGTLAESAFRNGRAELRCAAPCGILHFNCITPSVKACATALTAAHGACSLWEAMMASMDANRTVAVQPIGIDANHSRECVLRRAFPRGAARAREYWGGCCRREV